jgi:hypothetical protein
MSNENLDENRAFALSVIGGLSHNVPFRVRNVALDVGRLNAGRIIYFQRETEEMIAWCGSKAGVLVKFILGFSGRFVLIQMLPMPVIFFLFRTNISEPIEDGNIGFEIFREINAMKLPCGLRKAGGVAMRKLVNR